MLQINRKEIEKNNTFKGQLKDEDGNVLDYTLTLQDLNECTAQTMVNGELVGNAMLNEKLDLGFALDNKTLTLVLAEALAYFFKEIPR